MVRAVKMISIGFLALAAAVMSCAGEQAEKPLPEKSTQAKVVVIPIRAQIAGPELYILRRGLKEAIEANVDTIILDMETPGGSAQVTMEMMEALDRFPGRKVTFVNDDAGSAGAIIAAVTDEIFLAPTGVIGAAELISGDGQDVGDGLKRKMNSYLSAKIRAFSDYNPMRANVIKAMMDPEFEFKIGEEMIKPKGELLSLTAQEAVKTYGDPAQELLGAGIAENLDGLLDKLYGQGNYTVTHLQITWSEKLAQYLTMVTPILLGLGMLCLFIEFKTPGFGVFGISGIVLIGTVFFGQFAAGLSGHEPALIFLVGLTLVAVEVFFFPGTLVPAITGALMMLGSLVWAMLDLWPEQPISLSGDALLIPLANVMGGVALAVLIFLAILRFLPKGGPWGGMILQTAVGGEPDAVRPLNLHHLETPVAVSLVGQTGIAATALFPSGQITLDGRRYEAKLAVGFAEAGTPVKITGIAEFGLIVEVLS